VSTAATAGQSSYRTAGSPAAPAETQLLRLLTWNVQHANPRRTREQVAWLVETEADLLVLTEVSGHDGGHTLSEALQAWGYSTHVATGVGRDYRVLLAARSAVFHPVPRPKLRHLPHRCLAARLPLGDSGHSVGLVGLYVPSRGGPGGRNVAKRAFQHAVTSALPALATTFPPGAGPLLVAGDLNVVERGHRPHHAVFGKWEYDFYDSFPAAGLYDAFRHLHPDVIDHSWHGRSGAGYRFDHIFCSGTSLGDLTDVRYLQQPRLARLSDHAAMTAALIINTGNRAGTDHRTTG
jgi:exodeoxyribonuclease-3